MEIRDRKVQHYVNDLCSYTANIPEVVFGFTLEELEGIQSYIPDYDGFHTEIINAIEALRIRAREEKK